MRLKEEKKKKRRRRRRGGAAASSSTTFSTSAYVTKEARQTAFGLAKEQVEEANAPVSGNLPSWLRGTVVINGCGDYRGMEHLFDGFAFLTRIHLDGVTGRATASQRFLDTDAYRSFRKTGRMKYREFQTPVPADGPVGRVQVVLENIKALMSKGRAFTDNASINLIPLPGNRLLALGETRSAAYIVDPATLATVRQVEYDDDFPGDLTTAHPKVAPDGSIMSFTRSLPLGGYHVFRQDPVTLRRTKIAFIRDRNPWAPCWVHDMAITSSSLVVVETPLFISMASLILGTKRPYAFMDWKPEAGSRVHVIALDGSGVVTHTAPAFFTFHLGNAFERPSGTSSGTEICLDFSVYDDPEIINDLSLARLKAFPGKDISPGRLRRLVIPLRDAANRPVGPSTLAAPVPLLIDENAYGNFFEFPAINPRFRGKPYRYMYGTAAIRPTNMGNALARHDVEKGNSIVCSIPGSMPGQPIFVPRPDGSTEDDGVLLAPKIMPGGRSVLCVYDAADMSGLANVDLPFKVPYRFHGAYVAAKD
ncbi:hypothetical protein VOLCADRAFT_107173 [Volvox carteri f. nagariensis]|uniref:Carotenoid cleavage dioxygenase n=1 Tax=Volvox carteri f. nagariensis TaxID=3068 RepID=D8UCE3_VOLCA|nr:uncharacterized protein VOLCADRAFT_107173 [Volvox carteri f. nagariensis]EFJ42683.1 hypothetical protein VOLCADRAFT_107173 [Volvox carteri f. nagariensis]|eukprot:XP_002956334.1 hypothetical protein VOLCADRAFT_107173 [Volvox carteri f. nagariensis]